MDYYISQHGDGAGGLFLASQGVESGAFSIAPASIDSTLTIVAPIFAFTVPSGAFSVAPPSLTSTLTVGVPAFSFTTPGPFAISPPSLDGSLVVGAPAFAFSGPQSFAIAPPSLLSTLILGTASADFFSQAPIGATLIETIQATLAPLAAGGAWYQLNTAEPPVDPFIVWQRIPSATNNTLQGASDLQNTRVEISCYSRSVATLQALADDVRDAMAAAAFTNVLITSRDLFEPDTRFHRTVLEFSVWST